MWKSRCLAIISTSVQAPTRECTGGLQKLKSQKNNDPVKKWANELNRAFSKEVVQMVKKHMKKCSIFPAIKEMKIKTTSLLLQFQPL
jgi:hypothetical protein